MSSPTRDKQLLRTIREMARCKRRPSEILREIICRLSDAVPSQVSVAASLCNSLNMSVQDSAVINEWHVFGYASMSDEELDKELGPVIERCLASATDNANNP